MGLLSEWGEMARDIKAENNHASPVMRREGNVLFLRKEGEERLPFTPENDKIAVLLELARAKLWARLSDDQPKSDCEEKDFPPEGS